jgi:hypothetical protein
VPRREIEVKGVSLMYCEVVTSAGITEKVQLVTMSLDAADVWRLTSARKETQG